MRKVPFLMFLAALPVLALVLGDYRGGLLAQFSMYGIATAALAVGWGYCGVLNLGHAVSFGIGAYVAAWFGSNLEGSGTIIGLGAGTLAAGGVALVIGIVGLRGRVNHIAFALLTFVALLATIEVANKWTGVTGGFNGLGGIPTLHVGTAWTAGVEAQRIIVTCLASLLLALMYTVTRGPLGGVLSLVRDNPTRAASLGFDVPAVRIGVFAGTGALTGLAGSLFSTQVQFVSPNEVGLGLSTSFVIWAMIGSRVSVVGGFIAAIVFSFATSELSDAFLATWLLILGLVFLAVVVVLPDGLAVAISHAVPKRLRRPPSVVLTRESAGGDIAPRPDNDLVTQGITCRFGAFVAVDSVDITFRAGEVHCLIGPNGAGKTTFLNAISATHLPRSGTWSLGGHELSMRPPWEQARSGVARKFQSPSVATSLTVAQNLALAVWGPAVRARSLLGVVRWAAALPGSSWRVLEAGRLTHEMHTVAGNLSHGQRQLLELAMTFAGKPSAILLDEPTAGMTRTESGVVAELIRHEARALGVPIVVVEHDMALIRTAASTVTVLMAGQVLAEGTVADIELDQAVQDAYLGGSHR